MADLVMMTCSRRNLKLSTAGCARAWEAAERKKPEPWESHLACRFCPVGAANAGRAIAPLAEMKVELQKTCPRCERVTERLINGKLCVSCYNRHAEAAKGRNAKGGRPALCSQLHTQTVAVGKGNARPYVHHAEMVLSRTESLMAMARNADSPLGFGMPPISVHLPGWQMELAI